ncbi:MAG: hypothetical protein M1814_005357 [Vezdaea aestivalis]|nr:MAG: hypothetical protein M1814_005357 [Vezdaea aestivalis]
MALTFATGTNTLVTWGFGLGDVAALAGAGRAVGNWIRAPKRDQDLLDFLAASSESIIQRRGLVNTVALHERWDKTLVLLKNGRRHNIQTPSGRPLVENMTNFTWFMSMVVAALDSAVSAKMMRTIVCRFLMAAIGNENDGVDYLKHEVKYHIEGWLSIAVVRRISVCARAAWNNLGTRGKHLPGEIPQTDDQEILRLILWIVQGKENKFYTASSDVLAFALVLNEIGLELLIEGSENSTHDERYLVVCLSSLPILYPFGFESGDRHNRFGMRIPLNEMEECVSLWPGDSSLRNSRRHTFLTGAQAAEGTRLVVCMGHYPMDEEDLDVRYVVKLDNDVGSGRLLPSTYEMSSLCLMAETAQSAKGMKILVDRWPTQSRDTLSNWLGEVQLDQVGESEIRHFDPMTRECMAQLQTFLMGYYYQLLRPLIDFSQLQVQEAYGSWGWEDLQLIKVVRALKIGKSFYRENEIDRHDMMKVVGYLFAGADYHEQLRPLRAGTVGLLGKLALVTSSLMGDVDTPQKVGRFYLLDIDSSCLPSSSRGLILGGARRICCKMEVTRDPTNIDLEVIQQKQPDFTSHVEPDWDFDVQRVLVAYRYKGRIIHRVNPIQMDISILISWIPPVEEEKISQRLDRAVTISLEELYGGQIHRLGEDYHKDYHTDAKLIYMTMLLPKARACLTAMRGGNATLRSNCLTAANDKWRGAIIA